MYMYGPNSGKGNGFQVHLTIYVKLTIFLSGMNSLYRFRGTIMESCVRTWSCEVLFTMHIWCHGELRSMPSMRGQARQGFLYISIVKETVMVPATWLDYSELRTPKETPSKAAKIWAALYSTNFYLTRGSESALTVRRLRSWINNTCTRTAASRSRAGPPLEDTLQASKRPLMAAESISRF